jgi:hypothetical protein
MLVPWIRIGMRTCPKNRYAKIATKQTRRRNLGVNVGKKNWRILLLGVIDNNYKIEDTNDNSFPWLPRTATAP